MVRYLLPMFVLCGLVLPASPARCQFGTPFMVQSDQPDTERTQRWKAGTIVAAARGPCAGIYGTFTVPVDWPEQDVKAVEEDVSDTVRRTSYRNLDDGAVRQMVFVIPQLQAGEKAEVLVTFEITRRIKPVPADTLSFRLPEQIPRNAQVSRQQSFHRLPQHQDPQPGQAVNGRKRLGLGESAGAARLGPRERRVHERGPQGIARSTARQERKSPGPVGALYRTLPSQQDTGAYGVGSQLLLRRILPGKR